MDQAEPQENFQSPTDSPLRLTPSQLSTPSLQFEAAESESGETSKVVSSSYLEGMQVKVRTRKTMTKTDASELPPVSRISVPTRR